MSIVSQADRRAERQPTSGQVDGRQVGHRSADREEISRWRDGTQARQASESYAEIPASTTGSRWLGYLQTRLAAERAEPGRQKSRQAGGQAAMRAGGTAHLSQRHILQGLQE